LLAFAGAVLALGRVIPPLVERLLETGVGLMLVLLGADVLRRVWRQRIRLHLHRHVSPAGPGVVHAHAHRHPGAGADTESAPDHRHPHRWPLRALAVGMVHGLAGSAALLLSSLQATPTWPLGLGYIALFGLGSIAGMALLSLVIAAPLRLSARHLTGLHQVAQTGVGLFSCTFGAFTIARLGG
jgi:hypothetical protein